MNEFLSNGYNDGEYDVEVLPKNDSIIRRPSTISFLQTFTAICNNTNLINGFGNPPGYYHIPPSNPNSNQNWMVQANMLSNIHKMYMHHISGMNIIDYEDLRRPTPILQLVPSPVEPPANRCQQAGLFFNQSNGDQNQIVRHDSQFFNSNYQMLGQAEQQPLLNAILQQYQNHVCGNNRETVHPNVTRKDFQQTPLTYIPAVTNGTNPPAVNHLLVNNLFVNSHSSNADSKDVQYSEQTNNTIVGNQPNPVNVRVRQVESWEYTKDNTLLESGYQQRNQNMDQNRVDQLIRSLYQAALKTTQEVPSQSSGLMEHPQIENASYVDMSQLVQSLGISPALNKNTNELQDYLMSPSRIKRNTSITEKPNTKVPVAKHPKICPCRDCDFDERDYCDVWDEINRSQVILDYSDDQKSNKAASDSIQNCNAQPDDSNSICTYEDFDFSLLSFLDQSDSEEESL